MGSNKPKKRVLIIHTGGTIAMGLPNPAYSPDQAFAKHLLSAVPELKQLAQVKVLPLFDKDSSQLTPQDWITLAKTVLQYEEHYDGFVITHGTDTMAYTATALSYILPYPFKPVVFTGSQRPLHDYKTDARRNLICSVTFAAQQQILETSIFFDTRLLRGNRAVKVHIEEFQAFDSPNFTWLAEERLKTKFFPLSREKIHRPHLGAHFEGAVQVIRAYPGMQVDLSPKAKCVLIEAFGCGNLPMDGGSLLKLMKEAKKRRIPLVLSSQVSAGALHPATYEMGRRALELGAIASGDMTFEATIIKCMMLLGNKVLYQYWPAAISANWAGELTV